MLWMRRRGVGLVTSAQSYVDSSISVKPQHDGNDSVNNEHTNEMTLHHARKNKKMEIKTFSQIRKPEKHHQRN
jgi:hypothetical protein